jgi:mitochondrial fission protein ELM1
MNAAMFVAYNQKPQKVIGAFLALSETVFVTEESASMVSEAVASGKSVITIKPEYMAMERDYLKILEKFSEGKKIERQAIADLGYDHKVKSTETGNISSIEEIQNKLHEFTERVNA